MGRRRLLAAVEEVGQRGLGADLRLGRPAGRELTAEAVAGEDALLEVVHPRDHRGVGDVGCADRDIGEPGDPRRLLELVDVLKRGQVARDELPDVGDHRDSRPDAPARDGEDRGDQQHPARRAQGKSEGAASRVAGPLADRSSRGAHPVDGAGGGSEPPGERRAQARGGTDRRETPPLALVLPARPQQREAREAGGEGERERDDDSQDEEQGEAADHRDRRQDEHEEPGRGGEPRGRDHRAAAGRRLDRGSGRRDATPSELEEPGLELDRVVDREPDQHRQNRDRGHRQRAAHEREEAERDPRGAEGDRERQESQRRFEDERERDDHRGERGREKDEDLDRELLREPVEDHRDPADDVARRRRAEAGGSLQLERGVGDRLAKEGDRLGAFGVAEPRAKPNRDQGRVGARHDGRQPRLRRAPGHSAVADHRLDIARVVEPGRPGLAVLDGEVLDLLLELHHDLLAGREPRLLLLHGREPLALGARHGPRGCPPRPQDRGLGLLAEELVRLDRELVEEGRRAEDDVARVERGDTRARRGGRLAREHLTTRRLARKAALERQETGQVAGQKQLPEVPLDQHLHRLVTELVVEALGLGVGLGAAIDEGAGTAVGLEAKRRDRADQRQQHRRRNHRRRPFHGPPGDPCQNAPHRTRI